jgi:hypothetical protein
MADFKHGTMDITAQTKTYEGFVKFVARSIVALVVIALFLAVFMT